MKNVADIYALSPMQQLMLFHARTASTARSETSSEDPAAAFGVAPGVGLGVAANDTVGVTHDVLFNQIVYTIEGPLDADLYQRAWQLMVDRHPALRTIFVWQDGKAPLQVIREEATLPWTFHDWRALSPSEQESALNDLLTADRAAGFDPLHAPLMRLALVRLTDTAYHLVWSSHHLIIDRWCIGILFDEVKEAYDAEGQNRPPLLKPAPRYRDYIAWLAEQDEAAAQAYWRESLRDLDARPLVSRQKRDARTGALATERLWFDGQPWSDLRQFARDNNLTPSTLIAGAWALVLAAATGADDSVFGLTVSGRPAELVDVARTVGCFINNVPLRVRLDGDPILISWLQTLQEQEFELQAYEYASLAQIEAWSDSPSRGSLFDTLLVLQAPVSLAAPSGLVISYAGGGMETGYPISLGAVPDRDDLRLAFTYETGAVPASLIEQLAVAIRVVLETMPNNRHAPLSSVRASLPVEAVGAKTTLAGPPARANGHMTIPSRTRTETALAGIWAGVLGVDHRDVGVTERFSELGGDSIRSMHLFTAIEEQLGVRLPISLFFADPTIEQMAAAMGDSELSAVNDPIVVRINEGDNRSPVFFTHGVEGGMGWLRNIGPLLDPDQPAYGLQAIGLQADEQPDLTLEAMATRYVAAMRRVQPAGPYYLAGFCFGGVLAYEVARQLEQLGERTDLLAILDGFPHHVPHRQRPLTDPLRLEVIRESAPYWLRGYGAFGGWRLRERVGALLRRKSLFSGESSNPVPGGPVVSQEGEQSLKERQDRLTRINERAAEAYVPGPYGGTVTMFSARLIGARQALFGPIDPQRRWSQLAAGGVIVHPVWGSHVGILSPPFVADVAAQLNATFRAATLAER